MILFWPGLKTAGMYRKFEDLPVSAPPEGWEGLYQRALKEKFPLLSPHSGRQIRLLCRLLKPQKIADVGAGFGGSAIWMVEAFSRNARIWLLDYDQNCLVDAQAMLQEKREDLQIELLPGRAQDGIAHLPEDLDLAFVDIDGSRYLEVLEPLMKRIRPGGLLVYDNLSVGGRLFQPDGRKQKALDAIQGVLRKMEAHPEWEVSALSSGDGLLILQRLADFSPSKNSARIAS